MIISEDHPKNNDAEIVAKNLRMPSDSVPEKYRIAFLSGVSMTLQLFI